MNTITRVGISLLALGACAVAMRYTMTEVDVPEAKRQYHTWRRDIPASTRALAVSYAALERRSWVDIKAGSPGRIAGTYQGSPADRLSGVQVKAAPKQVGALHLSVNAGRMEYASYFLARPSLIGVADLRLPTGVSLEVSAHVAQDSRARIDLRGLNLYSFCLCNFPDANLDLSLTAPDRPFKNDLFVHNDLGTTKLEIPRGARGSISLIVRNGRAQIYVHNSLNARLSVNANLPFNARDTTDLKRRVNVRNKAFFGRGDFATPIFEGPTRGYFMSDNYASPSPQHVGINIELGSTGTVEILGPE
jgi:hypothetical protein